MQRTSYPKVIFAALMTIYFFWIALRPLEGSFLLDNLNLAIHEAGHLFFSVFGQFIGVAGGSFFQLFVPAVFIGYFIWHFQYYSAAIVTFWLGESLLNVWVYAADAVTMQIILLGGLSGSEGGFHDWNYLLSELGLLGSTKIVAGVIRAAGTLTIITAAAASFYYALHQTPEETIYDI